MKITEEQLKKRILILKNVSIFSHTSEKILSHLAELMTVLTVSEGEPIFEKGDDGNSMFVITKGCVEIHDGNYVFTVLKREDFFGEYSLVEEKSRSATATAVVKTKLLRLDQKVFYPVVEKHPNMLWEILRSIIHRLHDKDLLEEELSRKNAEIMQQKEEIESQRDEIETQRDEIETQRDEVIKQRDTILLQKKEMTDSIRYAGRIQTAMLPPKHLIKKHLPQYFVFYQPCDIVSGDFYWVTHFQNKTIFAAADCTGHGVPGAFMSMLGITLLNQIVHKNQIQNAAEILNLLRQELINALNQDGSVEETQDGIDIALCLFESHQENFEHLTIQYAGANCPLYLVRNINHTPFLYEIKPDKMPAGISFSELKPFTNHTLEVRNGDTIYLFSDGYAHQFGGEHNKKFLTQNFKQLLMDISVHNMDRQKNLLESTITRWMGKNHSQLDDILVMGVKV